MAASASVRRAASFILVISSSSPLATASVSYFWRQHWASPSALATSLRVFSRPADSSSRAQRAPSSSCSKFLYFPKSSPLSRASLSHRAFTSLSWAARAAFCLAKMLRLLSRSPTMRRRSEFSQEILFLLEAKSPRVRLASSTFLLMALRVSSIFLLDMSAEACALTTSSVAARASEISFMIATLSFSILLFILPRASICSVISAMASPCFLFKFARMFSCWMLASSTSLRSFCTSASLPSSTAQVELNKKREAEVQKLRKDVEEANIQQENILANLKRKQGDAIAEMTEQIDALGKMKSKIEKDKVAIMNEISDARAATDEVMRSQASADMANKKAVETLNAINKKVDNANLTLGDYATSKNKIACENSDLLRIVGDLDNNLNILAKQKAALAAQLNDVKALCDNEARERGLLLGKYRNLEHELDGARCALEEESAGRENPLRLVAKAEAESQCWRQKYETDAVAKGEELEMTKMKLTARLTEAEAAIDNLNAKLNQVEKAKGKIASEIAEMTSSLDQAQVLNAAMDKGQAVRQGHWRVEGQGRPPVLRPRRQPEGDPQRLLRVVQVKSAYEETMLQLEEVRRENKTLS